MTSDTIQDNQIQLKARVTDASHFSRKPIENDLGIELTRLQNFLDGRHDIFDVLESHAANTQMKIRAPLKRKVLAEDDLSQSSLFRSLWLKLKTQMGEIGSDFKDF